MSRRTHLIVGILLAGVLALSACGGTTSGSGNGTPDASATTAATATNTAKPEPSSLPPITLAYCQQLMTTAEASQIMGLTINTIVPDDGGDGGSCTYKGGSSIDLTIYFITGHYNGPKPIPQDYLTGALSQAEGLPGVTVDSATTVDGVGDQAVYMAASGTKDNFTGSIHIFYVLYGTVLFDCFTTHRQRYQRLRSRRHAKPASTVRHAGCQSDVACISPTGHSTTLHRGTRPACLGAGEHFWKAATIFRGRVRRVGRACRIGLRR